MSPKRCITFKSFRVDNKVIVKGAHQTTTGHLGGELTGHFRNNAPSVSMSRRLHAVTQKGLILPAVTFCLGATNKLFHQAYE